MAGWENVWQFSVGGFEKSIEKRGYTFGPDRLLFLPLALWFSPLLWFVAVIVGVGWLVAVVVVVAVCCFVVFSFVKHVAGLFLGQT